MPPSRTILLLLLFLVPSGTAWAQESGLAFLRVGTNAAAAGMGDVQVASSRDAFSTYWNPAGLAAAASNAVGLSFHAWVADLQTYNVSTRFRAGEQGGIGFFVTATGSGDLAARERPGPAEGTFNVQFISTGIAYGRAIGPVRLGATAKYLSERVFTESANGYAVDLGAQADLFGGDVQAGVAVQNLGSMGDLHAEATPLPRLVRGGVSAAVFTIRSEDDAAPLLRTRLAAEVVHLFPDERTQFHVGAEGRIFDVIDVRAGYITNEALRRFTVGMGLGYDGIQFDYAFVPFVNDFQDTGHVLTLTYGW